MIVSEKALVARINRKLAHEGERLRVYRGGRWESDLGRFYITDSDSRLLAQHVNLAALAAELGVLRAGEALAD